MNSVGETIGDQTPGTLIAGDKTVIERAGPPAANYAVDIITDTAALYQPKDADLTAIAALTTTGFLKRTGTNTWALSAFVTGIMKDNGSGVVSAAAAGTDYVAPGSIIGDGLTMNTARILGRTTASTGAIEEISAGSGLALSATTLAVSGLATASGLTQSTARMLGRTTASTGAIEEISIGAGLSLSAGTLNTAAESNQNANVVHAGPATGSPAAPTYRALVQADLGALQSMTQYTPTFTAFGTVSSVNVWWSRVGNILKVQGNFNPGTTTGSEARISLPNSGTSDTNIITALSVCGTIIATATTNIGYCLIESGAGYVTIGRADGVTQNGLAKQNGNIWSSSGTISFQFEVPMTGWN